MSTTNTHNKLIRKIALERLSEFGCVQKGQSRLFFKDCGWYCIIIEFQPSSWAKGSYLNIGLDFNFYPRPHFAFDFNYREDGFTEFSNEEQFADSIHAMCDSAIKKLHELMSLFSNFSSAIAAITKRRSSDAWQLYDLAVLHALNCNYTQAGKMLHSLCEENCERDWEKERKIVAQDLLSSIQDSNQTAEKIQKLILQTRRLKKLPEIELVNVVRINQQQTMNTKLWWKTLFKR